MSTASTITGVPGDLTSVGDSGLRGWAVPKLMVKLDALPSSSFLIEDISEPSGLVKLKPDSLGVPSSSEMRPGSASV